MSGAETTTGYKIKSGSEMIASFLQMMQGEEGAALLGAVNFLVDLLGVVTSPLLDKKKDKQTTKEAEGDPGRPFTDSAKEHLNKAIEDAKKELRQYNPTNTTQANAANNLSRELNKLGKAVDSAQPNGVSTLQQLIDNPPQVNNNADKSVNLGVENEKKQAAKRLAERMAETIIKTNALYGNSKKDMNYYNANPAEKQKYIEKLMQLDTFKAITRGKSLNSINELVGSNDRNLFGLVQKELNKENAKKENPERNKNRSFEEIEEFKGRNRGGSQRIKSNPKHKLENIPQLGVPSNGSGGVPGI